MAKDQNGVANNKFVSSVQLSFHSISEKQVVLLVVGVFREIIHKMFTIFYF